MVALTELVRPNGRTGGSHDTSISQTNLSAVIGYLRKGREKRHRYHRQEEILSAIRPDGWTVRVRHSEENQAISREGNLYIC